MFQSIEVVSALVLFQFGATSGRIPTCTGVPPTVTAPPAGQVPALISAALQALGATANCCNALMLAVETPAMPPKVWYPAAVGANRGEPGDAACPIGWYSKLAKKNSLFLKIGPPICPPKRLSSRRGTSVTP